MNHASLFSGIGGFDLAAEWMGWTNIFNCDIEEFPRKVLNYHFPNAKQYADIKQTDFTIHRGEVDILTGGFPCQPFSMAGKRLGKNDERHLWPEMYRAIREIKPKWIVGENVRGLLNWSDGLVLDEVYIDLENEGYEIETFVLPAASINAPHKRDRVWVIAYNTSINGCNGRGNNWQERHIQGNINREPSQSESERERREYRISQDGSDGYVAYPESNGWMGGFKSAYSNNREWVIEKGISNNRSEVRSKSKRCSCVSSNTNCDRSQEYNISPEPGKKEFNSWGNNEAGKDWSDFPAQSPICGGDDGFPGELDGITVSKWRKESIKAYGNAIVPQIAYRIFKTIEQVELDTNQ